MSKITNPYTLSLKKLEGATFIRCRRECEVRIDVCKRQIATLWLGTLSGPWWAPQGFICKQSNKLPYSAKD